MDISFKSVPFNDIEDAVRHHLARLPSPIDSFLEDHIMVSSHYQIQVSGQVAGFTTIHNQQLITQFALDEPFHAAGQAVFARLRRTEQVQSAFVPTCDEFFLSHALDDYRRLAMQAYFFVTGPTPRAVPDGFTARAALPGDRELIEAASGDFFDELERRIAGGELVVTERDGEPVAFGIRVMSALQQDVASIGMFTLEAHRRTGAGTATIVALIAACLQDGIRPIAGCWYYNHGSKRTLERAGMYAPTRLLKVDF
jgi:GNAT superfamily N-acetyltransferase